MRLLPFYPAVCAITAAALVSSCHHKEQTPAYTSPTVEVSPVTIDSVTIYRTYPATLTADRTVDVVARVNGEQSDARFKGGDHVKAGQVLFVIDPTIYKNAFEQAQASLTQAQADNAYAEQHYEAVKKAYEKNAASQMELSQALSNRDQSRASITSAQAALDDARVKLGYCTVTAPIDGYITTNIYAGGTYISGEGAPVTLATVYDDSKVTVNFTLEDDSFMRMFENPNNRHLIDYTAIPVEFQEKLPHEYTADLTYLAPNVNASTGTMSLQAKIHNPHHELRSGMYCTISLPYKVDPRALLVSDAAISTDQLGKFVYVVNDSNKVVYTPIETGDMVGDSLRLVTKGLKPGDRYVTSAILKVRDGMRVKTVSAPAPKSHTTE